MAEPVFRTGDKLAHAYIVSAPNGEEAMRYASCIAASALCTGPEPKPCGSCRACRKVFSGVHPDVGLLEREADDKGNRKKEIRVDQIRSLILDAQVMPNEADRKVYIIYEADTMNQQAQNAALKLLEEPPAGVVFVLCVTNEDLLLPTVRSRCVSVSVNEGEAKGFDEETQKCVKGYLRAVASGDALKLVKWSVAAENMDPRQAKSFCCCLRELCTAMLCRREDSGGLQPVQLADIIRLADRFEECLRVNTGVKHLLGMMSVRAPIESRNRGNEID